MSPSAAANRRPKARARDHTHLFPPPTPLRLFDEPSPGLFPSREELARLLAVIAITASVAIACHYAVGFLNRQPRPFCDSGEDPQDFCEPCPDHGECIKGNLECFHGYKKHGRKCVEDGEINRTAKKLSELVERHICEAYARVLCGGTGTIWFQEAEIANILDQNSLKENIGLKNDTLMLAKQKTMETAESNLETRTVPFGIKEFKCPDWLTELQKPYQCCIRQWIYKHSLLVFLVSALLVGLMLLIRRVLQKQYLSSRAEQLYEEVCEILEEHAVMVKSANNEGERWVVFSWLRDHLLLPRESRDAMLWKKVEELVQEDSRIDQYPKLIKGEQKIVLEWQAEGSLSSKMRKKGPASTKKLRNSFVNSSHPQQKKLQVAETPS